MCVCDQGKTLQQPVQSEMRDEAAIEASAACVGSSPASKSDKHEGRWPWKREIAAQAIARILLGCLNRLWACRMGVLQSTVMHQSFIGCSACRDGHAKLFVGIVQLVGKRGLGIEGRGGRGRGLRGK